MRPRSATSTGLSPSTFNLSNGGSRPYANVPAGSYSVTESTLPGGWELRDLSCTASAGTSATPTGSTVSITLAGGADDPAQRLGHDQWRDGHPARRRHRWGRVLHHVERFTIVKG
jgi:hypothetical protein